MLEISWTVKLIYSVDFLFFSSADATDESKAAEETTSDAAKEEDKV